MRFVTAKVRAHFQFTNLNGIRVESLTLFVGKTKKRTRDGLAGAYSANLHAIERPADVKN